MNDSVNTTIRFSIVILCIVLSTTVVSAQTSNLLRLRNGRNKTVVTSAAAMIKPFGGFIIYKMYDITCPGFGPWIIRPSNSAPAGPYYLANDLIANLQDRLNTTLSQLNETRSVIDHITRDGGIPNQLTLDEEKSQVEQMKNLRTQLESNQNSSISPSRWILGNYKIISEPCYTNSVPPVPVPAFAITSYAIQPRAYAIGR